VRLLTVEDLAVLLDCSVSHVRQNIITHPAFPSPFLVPGSGARPMKRWDADEIETFLRRLKPAAPSATKRPRGRPPKDGNTSSLGGGLSNP
jgi:hypothetical protein